MQELAANLNTLPNNTLLILFIAIIWDLAWKGIGMWNAAERGQKGWFIAILLINSIGIIPIVYITWFKKDK
jgi:uncharacterized membrane protein YiaA